MSNESETLRHSDQLIPWDWFDRAHAGCPAHRADDGWLEVGRYEVVRDILKNNEVFSSFELADDPNNPLAGMMVQALVFADEPIHTVQRRMVNRAFTPRRVEALVPRIERDVDDLIDRFVAAGACDIIESFAHPLPVGLIADVVGVPLEDREKFGRWADDFIVVVHEPTKATERAKGLMEFVGYAIAKKEERLALLAAGEELPADLLTDLVVADGEQQLSQEEFILITLQMLAAGHDSTTSMLGNAVYLLCSHPEEMRKLKGNPELIDGAIEETLRIASPVMWRSRTANSGYDLHGLRVEEGQRFRVSYGAANVDPQVWDCPEEFRIDRDFTGKHHVAFGYGKHNCVGAALARWEGKIAVSRLLERLTDLRLDPDRPPVPRESTEFSTAWQSLHVIWTSEQSQ